MNNKKTPIILLFGFVVFLIVSVMNPELPYYRKPFLLVVVLLFFLIFMGFWCYLFFKITKGKSIWYKDLLKEKKLSNVDLETCSRSRGMLHDKYMDKVEYKFNKYTTVKFLIYCILVIILLLLMLFVAKKIKVKNEFFYSTISIFLVCTILFCWVLSIYFRIYLMSSIWIYYVIFFKWLGITWFEKDFEKTVKNNGVFLHSGKTEAYHEVGHAVISLKLKYAPKFQKITLFPKEEQIDNFDLIFNSKQEIDLKEKMLAYITYYLGSKISEELISDDVSCRAHNDFKQATKIAKLIVTKYGMSTIVPVQNSEFSDKKAIDSEIKKIIDNCYQEGKQIITQNKSLFEKICYLLLELKPWTYDEIKRKFKIS